MTCQIFLILLIFEIKRNSNQVGTGIQADEANFGSGSRDLFFLNEKAGGHKIRLVIARFLIFSAWISDI